MTRTNIYTMCERRGVIVVQSVWFIATARSGMSDGPAGKTRSLRGKGLENGSISRSWAIYFSIKICNKLLDIQIEHENSKSKIFKEDAIAGEESQLSIKFASGSLWILRLTRSTKILLNWTIVLDDWVFGRCDCLRLSTLYDCDFEKAIVQPYVCTVLFKLNDWAWWLGIWVIIDYPRILCLIERLTDDLLNDCDFELAWRLLSMLNDYPWQLCVWGDYLWIHCLIERLWLWISVVIGLWSAIICIVLIQWLFVAIGYINFNRNMVK